MLSTLAKPASAATVSWLAAVDGNWNDGTKWSGGSPPGPTDDAQITVTGAAFTVTLDVSPSVKSLQLGNTTGSQTLLASGQTLTVSDSVGVATTGRLALRSGSSIAGNLTNAGTVVANGSSNSVTGTYKSSAGSTLQVQCANVFANAQLTMANGFTNRGLIELSGTVNFFLGARLTVTNGTLTNAGTGTITSLESGGGPRVIDAQLNNQGAINVSWPLDVPKANAAHLNSGSITLDNTTNGVLTVTQSPSGSFTNQQGATYTLNSGTSLVFDNGTLHYDPVTTTDTGQVVVKNCTVVGVTLASTSAPFVLRANNTVDNINNAGTVIAQGNPNAVSGTYTSSAGSTLRIQCANVFANAQLTMANGFTNRGLIELSGTVNFFLGARLTVTNGTLTNAGTGTITSLESGGGPRVIDAQLNNQGAISVSWPLDVPKANAAHLNSGSITLDNTTNGVLTVAQSAAGSFSNQQGATYTLNSGTSLVFDNGTLHYDPVTTSGTGQVVVKNCTVVGVTLASTSAPFVLRANNTVDNINNAGTVIAQGNPNTVTGGYESSAGSTLRIQCANVFANAQLTMANGFTNRGLIELSGTVNFFLGAQLTVSNATLTNASTGTISSLESGGGPRVIDAQLNNQGAINVSWPLDVTKANAAHLNSGSITLDNTTNGVLTFTQSPAGSFSNQAGATYTLNSGTSLVFDNGTLHYDPVTTSGTGEVVVKNSNVVGVTLASTSAPFVLRANNTVDNITNAGTVVAQGNPNAVTGAYTSSAGSTLRIQCANVFANAQLTMANGFTNRGLIELSGTVNFFLGARLTVTNGTLTNAGTGTITSLESGGGPRVIDAQLDNQGAINVSWPLEVIKADAAHLNSGSITLDNTTNGVLTVTQSPAGSFSNQPGASYTLSFNTSLIFDNGTLHYDPVTTSGTGEVVVKNCTVVGVTLASTSAPFVLRGNNTVDNITNAGTMVAQGNPNTVTDTYTSSVGSTLRVQCAAVFANAQLTVTNGFTNRGLIEFTGAVNFFLGGRLTVTNGTLTNASTGIIRSLFGGAGGDHVVQGVVSNFGVLECADWPLQFAGGPVTNQPSGTVRGGNTLDVTGVTYVDNGSTRPGSSPGILTIQPNDTRGVTSALHIEIGGYTPGTSYDRLNVPGQVDLNGTLNISLIDGFVPSLGDSFAIVTAGTRSGEFSILSGIQITPTLAFQVKYKPDRVDLIAGVPPPDNAPIARDDQATTGEDHSVDIDVLANDSDPDKDAIHVVAGNFFGPFNGVVNFKDPGMEFVRYVPNSDFFGPDSFKYVITDNRGGQDTAVVRVTVTPLNDPPFFSAPPTRADTARVKIGFKKQLSFSVVSNDIDPGALVTLTSGPLPAGVSMFPPLPVMGHPAFSTLSWSPLREQMGFHYVDFLATDDSLATHRITVEIEVTDNPTSTTLAEFTATPGSEGIELAWRIADPGDFARLTLERADGPQGPWTALDIDGRAESGSLMDRGVAAGRDYFYRISGSAGGGTVVLGTIHTRTEPAVFALSSITPSPTRGKATRIAYALPRASNVRISVCDIQGREVAVVERGARNAGRHEVVWSNESADHPLPAGLYFVRLEAMGMRSIKRVILAP